ncbi:MAG: F0F1 ATP synthase subunit A [Ignavibacteriales bacterium]|nr:MAG: F0F1 ATP synthase subunit A [Ignavibacteriales bacterium]
MSENTALAVTDTLAQVKDTVAQAGKESDWIMHHILNGKELDFLPFGIIHLPELNFFGYDLLTKHSVFMVLIAAVLIFLLIKTAKSYKKSLVPKGMTNFFEVLILFVRDEIAKPTIGKGYEKFVPYLLTAFFFILFSNFFGLIPFSTTITSNITVTATLAIMSFFMIQIGGIRKNGAFGYFKGLIPHGIPIPLLVIMIPVEILGLFTKPFALALRLFANMTAGHIVIYALFSLIFISKSWGLAGFSFALALFVFFLEILVALLQAYIFTMLSSLFIGMAVHQDH